MLADMNSVTTNDCRQLAMSCCRLLRFRMAGFWGARAGVCKWQYILIAAFSSFEALDNRLLSCVQNEAKVIWQRLHRMTPAYTARAADLSRVTDRQTHRQTHAFDAA